MEDCVHIKLEMSIRIELQGAMLYGSQIHESEREKSSLESEVWNHLHTNGI